MKPFDLQAALRGEPVMTRDGKKVVRLAHLPEAEAFRVVVVFEEGSVKLYNETGTWVNCFSPYDLVMAPQKKVAWVNLYPSMDVVVYTSQEEADARAGSDRVGGKAHRIEWEE